MAAHAQTKIVYPPMSPVAVARPLVSVGRPTTEPLPQTGQELLRWLTECTNHRMVERLDRLAQAARTYECYLVERSQCHHFAEDLEAELDEAIAGLATRPAGPNPL